LGRIVSLRHPRAFVAVLIAVIACRENHLPTKTPRSISFGQIVASDATGCFELLPDSGVTPRPLIGVPEPPMPYEPPRQFELTTQMSDVPTQSSIAKALTPDSNGVRPVGYAVRVAAKLRRELQIDVDTEHGR
jgi:hypothetical protein